ncbi:MAG TPA: hypothetical protein VEJ67_18120 [Candidatus Cybelea sp.]|nr:hypothetical protein [Candidatus Cybelea sp.]
MRYLAVPDWKVKRLSVLAAALALLNVGPLDAAGSRHKVTVRFSYDFRNTPPCSATLRRGCVEQFNLYDISAGVAHRTKLMSIPVPSHVRRGMTEISATTPPLLWEPGKHLLALVAQLPRGIESDPKDCTVWVQIP